jgi:hypothetical protein
MIGPKLQGRELAALGKAIHGLSYLVKSLLRVFRPAVRVSIVSTPSIEALQSIRVRNELVIRTTFLTVYSCQPSPESHPFQPTLESAQDSREEDAAGISLGFHNVSWRVQVRAVWIYVAEKLFVGVVVDD